GPPPGASNLNFGGFENRANLMTVQVSGCTIQLANSPGTLQARADINFVVDLVGYYDSGGLQVPPPVPAPHVASRSGATPHPRPVGLFPPGATADVIAAGGATNVPSSALALVGNLTAVGPSSMGWLTIFKPPTLPAVASLNFGPGQTVANMSITGIN